jgi:glutathione S-transferase
VIRIHNFPRGGRGLRVAWLCEEMGLDYRVHKVTFPPSDEYRALHSLGSTPLLEDASGETFCESVAMLLYLAQKYGPTPLLPGIGDARFARVLELTVFGEATLAAVMSPLLVARFVAPEGEKVTWATRAAEKRGAQVVDFVAQRLGGAEYLVGDALSTADLSVSCGLGMWTGALGLALPDKLTSYQERLQARPAYQRALVANGSAS